MANKRISALPEKQNPSLNDILPLVDTQNPNNLVTKRTTIGSILALVDGGGGGGTGTAGATGATGATGPQGIAGATGPRGATGVQGATGPAGTQGSTGPQGPSGVRGATGPAGTAGLDGATGATGAIGATGVSGLVGATGARGATGPAGVTGATGAQGPAGATGAQGPAGSGVTIAGTASTWPPAENPNSGDMWLMSAPVPAGTPVGIAPGDGVVWSGTSWVNVGPVRGPQGETGQTGPQGATGPQGETGPIGATGPQGETGPSGPSGPTGVAGQPGPVGATGPQGETGPMGPAGSYDQSLNTEDSVTFEDVQVNNILAFKAAMDNSDTVYVTKQNLSGNISVLQIFVGDDGSSANVNAYYPIDGETTAPTDYVAILSTNAGVHHLFGTDGRYYNAGGIVFNNSSQISVGTLDTGGSGGVSLYCAVGYELNWQAGHLRNVIPGDPTPQTIYVDSPMLFLGEGSSMFINSSGLTFPDGSTQTKAVVLSGTPLYTTNTIDGGAY